MYGGNGNDGFLSPTHVVLFPFMSKGHTIPILHLASLLLRRGVTVTVITTPANRPFIVTFLVDTKASIVVLPFPVDISGIPPGVESTDKLPSISLFYQFASATKRMQHHFETFLSSLSDVSFIVSDGFLPWTLDSSSKFGIPRFVCYGMSCYPMNIFQELCCNRLQLESIESDNELFSFPNLPSVKLTLKDFEQYVVDPENYGTQIGSEFALEMFSATSRSHGVIVNSFYELEPVYFDHWNRNFGPKAWGLGPFCLGEVSTTENDVKSVPWMKWLDEMLENRKFVLYVAFGSQAEISREQFVQIQIGLEKSEMNFLWVVRGGHDEYDDKNEFENRVKNRGMVVREWVDQRAILEHGSVTGFLSHCGWNSVIESICAKVPILAWPMMAEQHLNARFVTEEIGVGIRVETCDGSVRGFVEWAGLEKMVRELMEGEKGKEARKKVVEMGGAARTAVADGGSSCQALKELIVETVGYNIGIK